MQAILQKKMGLPIDKLIVATNENDILCRVINSGEYKPLKVKPSLTKYGYSSSK